MEQFWHDYLYNPLLNVLIFLYSGFAGENFGVAIIELTVALRLALMPFTIIDERNAYRYETLNKKIGTLERDFKADAIKRKEKIRELLQQHKVNYWAKVFVLGIQAVVLVLIYQVFIGGIKFTPQETLYTWVTVIPAKINTMFLGFDLAERGIFWPAVVAVVLFLQIYSVQKKREHLVTRSDVMYMILFPLFTLVALFLLPTVKSIFILTSMFFSMAVFWLRQILFRTEKAAKS
ncbi:MAG: YidC/Oxa1 family membrane protein insertase [Patescibacteria group bacterium]